MSGGWQGADYLSPKWVADGWLWKQPLVVDPGSWVSQRYLSRKWVSDSWLHHVVTTIGASIEVGNVPGIALGVLNGSARFTARINATTATLPLVPFAGVVTINSRTIQANVPGLSLGVFNANTTYTQIADVTFSVGVASAFGYTKAVSATVASLPLAAINALVSVGADLSVAATQASLPLVVFPTTVKGNTSAQAVATVSMPLQAYAASVSIGLHVGVANLLSVDLAAIPTSVEILSNSGDVEATLITLPLEVLDADVTGIPSTSIVIQLPKLFRRYRGYEVALLPGEKRPRRGR